MNSDIGTHLHDHLQGLLEGLDLADGRIPAPVADEARADLDRVVRRLELGVHHTVVALVGGTGSGKSSMFNALTRLNFADVGVIRPTTSQASACTWHTDASALLDFLGVQSERRISRESALTGDEEAEFRGLVLLDLPDHDSINPENADLVDRLLPMIDLLIWVVDPQKYADNVLHEKYLQELTDRHEAMVVVVNQIDTVPEAGLDHIRSDIERLLVQDNLEDVPVLLASAKTGHGLGMIRDHMKHMITQESIAARTARDELRAVARRLRQALAKDTPALPQTAHVTAELAKAAGIPAVGESIRVAVSGSGAAALTKVQPPATSRIEAIRESWVEQVGGPLPEPWKEGLSQAVQDRGSFYSHVEHALDSVPLPQPVDVGAKWLRFFGWALVIVGIVAFGLAFYWSIAPVWWGVSAGVIALGLIGVIWARARRKRTARTRSQDYLNRVTFNLAGVVHKDLEEPAGQQLAIHDQVLQATRF
ncbi:MAG TPA: GTP-binding protein [Beutenbergiaceae bacterium]|nr:GTP-binding protein [Beutenbergiaceae bacterium]